jgi:RHS repeat-associated protein
MIANPSREFENGVYVEKWIGMHKECYSSATGYRATKLSQAFNGFIEGSINTVQNVLDTGAYGIDKYSVGKGESVSAGVSAYIGGVSGTSSLGGESRSLTEYIDLNGDRYPDLVSEDNVQYTKKTGGLNASLNRNSDVRGAMSTDSNGNWGVTASGSFGKSGKENPGSNGARPKTNGIIHIGKPASYAFGSGSSSAGISGSYSQGSNNSEHLWIDVNGDGLPDLLRKNSNDEVSVNLNFGKNTNYNYSYWGNFLLSSGSSKTYGGGLGFNYANGSIEAGVSLGGTDSSTNNTLIDLNGDGLIDKMSSTNSNISFNFNQGNKFSAAATDTFSASFSYHNSASTKSAAINGTATYSLIWPLYLLVTVIPLKLPSLSVTAAAGTSTNTTKKSISDFDNDGFPDLIEEVNSSTVRVYSSNIRRTNMLKTVTNPLGGTFTVDYKPQKTDYNNPNAKWVMTDITINDGYDKVNDGRDVYKKQFVYENGKYDRRERDFYGYETVKTLDYVLDAQNNPTATIYRTLVSKYHNNSYFLNGLLKESYVLKGNDETKKYSRTENFYEIKALNVANELLVPTSNLAITFDVGGREGRRSAAVVLAKTKNYLYELDATPLLTTEVNMTYDVKGRVVKYNNLGNINDANDDYSTTIRYASLQAGKNLLNFPQNIEVNTSSGLIRKRDIIYNPTNGTIVRIKAYTNGTNSTSTIMTYDIYGNLNQITYPTNIAGQAAFYKYVYDVDNNKYVVKITDSFNYTSSAIYDPKFDKILETVDLTANKMQYTYDTFGRNNIVRGPNEIAAGKPYTLQFKYFPKFEDLLSPGDVTTTSFVPVALTKHYDQQNPTNDIETYSFIDGLARPIQVKKDILINAGTVQAPTFVEAMSLSGKVVYDEFGRGLQQYHPFYETKLANTNFLLNEYTATYKSTTEYDELDRPTKAIDPDGNTSKIEYSISQDNSSVMGIKTKSIVDQNGSQQIISESYKDVYGRIISTNNVGTNGSIWTKFNYNAIGELQSYTDAENISTQYEYDMLGRKVKVNHPDNGITSFVYDNASNLVKLQTANLANDASLDPQNRFIQYNYRYNRLYLIKYPNTPLGANISNVNYEYGTTGNETGRLVRQLDATGTQYFRYGKMGEMTLNIRNVVGPNIPSRLFTTKFSYDSWNRLQTIEYPDNEKVNYSYDLGGNLRQMSGQVNGQNYNYIERIDYDYYEQRTYLKYGNQTETNYVYTPSLRRLSNLNVKTSNQQNLFNNNYNYDKVGNVTSLINNALPTANNMGGAYKHNFTYDNLNRLSSANSNFVGDPSQEANGNDYNSSYKLSMVYNNTHGIEQKNQDHFKNNTSYVPNTYQNNYTYQPGTHKVSGITDTGTNQYESYKYDLNGNMVSKSESKAGEKTFLWDELNRLRIVADATSNSMQHYIYDAAGERILKANSDTQEVYQNGTLVNTEITINSYTTYPSAFIVIDPQGVYSKHYYAGSQRIVSRIGESPISIFDNCISCFKNGEKTFDDKSLQESQIQDLQQQLSKAKYAKVGFKKFVALTYEAAQKAIEEGDDDGITDNKAAMPPAPPIQPIYYYHPDHLGTSTFLTDANGNAYKFFLNLPFGETMAEQKPSSYYASPYKFNGKELDEETGLYYYGARYYDPRTSIWLSVDPLAEKYPSISPYAYVANNPLRYIDPDGREIVIPTNLKGSERRTIMRNLRKLTDDKLSYDKSTGKVTISEHRTGKLTEGTSLINNLISDTHTSTITVGAKGSGNSANPTNWTDAKNGTGSNATVSFDPSANPGIPTENSKTGNVSDKKRPDYIGLGHELIHADHINNGDVSLTPQTHTYNDATGTSVTQTVINEELRTVGVQGVKPGDVTENGLRKEHSATRNKKRGAY